jgi:putative peptidoglycan lipid II flippase
VTAFDSDTKDLLRNSTTVSGLTGLGVISGFLVNAVIAARFGVGAETDAFFIAWTLPNMVTTFAHVSFSWTLVPLFAKRFTEESENSVWSFASVLLNLGTILFALLTLIGMLTSPFLVSLLAPGLDIETRLLAVRLSRISFLTIGFTAVVEVGMALLYARRFFVIPTILKLVANTAALLTVLLAGSTWGIAAVAIGYVLGEAGRVVILAAVLFGSQRFKYLFLFDVNYPGVKGAGRLMIAPLTGSLLRQGHLIVEKVIGSFLPPGSISALGYASRINNMIGGVFLGSITTALLPSLAATLKQDAVKAKQALMTALNFASIVSLFVGAGCIALSIPLVRLFFERGSFDQEATLLTGLVLAFYCIYILFYGHYRVITTYFYAAFKARMVVYLAICLMVFTLALDLVLVQFLQARGLALAHSVGMALTTALAYVLFKRMIGDFDWKGLITINAKIIIASTLMGLVAYSVEGQLSRVIKVSNTLSQILVLGLAGASGIAVFATIALLLRVEELQLALNWTSRKLRAVARLFPASKL